MPEWAVILLICGLYLVLVLGLGVWSGRTVSKSVTGYVAGDRTLGVVVLYFVLGASVFSSFAFLGAPGWAYSRGAAAFYIIAYGTVGMVPFYFLGPRTRQVGEALGFVTQAEMLSHRYDSRTLSVVLAVLSVVAFVPYLTLQMKGTGLLLDVAAPVYARLHRPQ
jgi:SSS family solute:Na+ symporter